MKKKHYICIGLNENDVERDAVNIVALGIKAPGIMKEIMVSEEKKSKSVAYYVKCEQKDWIKFLVNIAKDCEMVDPIGIDSVLIRF